MTQYLDWNVGDFVVCVKDLTPFAAMGEIVPELGRIYTIREFKVEYDRVGIYLVEIVNEIRRYDQGLGECFFIATSFRKLQKNRISIFTDMLNKIKEPENV